MEESNVQNLRRVVTSKSEVNLAKLPVINISDESSGTASSTHSCLKVERSSSSSGETNNSRKPSMAVLIPKGSGQHQGSSESINQSPQSSPGEYSLLFLYTWIIEKYFMMKTFVLTSDPWDQIKNISSLPRPSDSCLMDLSPAPQP
ncbi:hypothetical protein Anas_00176 [Armadillidium nasatum]|uniref:Uncharacterized protein n=1 Tax=Armadillidium nasatum TaxID=96803 RepID=A0A5N5TIF3_9CRUS|nr:hypothetical protein Anas_00176 [Armadillidium nasatum]